MKPFFGIIENLDIKTSDSGKLCGKTFVAKDLLDIEGYVTGAGNPDWRRTHSQAQKNCSAVQMILDQGACLIGKTVTDELAFSLDGLNVHYPVPNNPNMPDRIPGGSSSGSASAVANNVCDFALGTDTAGSIRVPSAFCGIYGMRPTHGRIPVDGVVPLGTTFDTIGWMSRSLEILNDVGSILLKDVFSNKFPEKLCLLEDTLDSLAPELHEPFLNQWKSLESLGFKQEKVKLPEGKLDEYSNLFFTTRGYEAWQAHGQWIEETNPKMGGTIRGRFDACKNITRGEYENALARRHFLINEIDQIIGDSVFILPTTCGFPPFLSVDDNELTKIRKKNILLNGIASFCGLPQLTIPFKTKQAKFAFSILARQNSDMELLALAKDFFSYQL